MEIIILNERTRQVAQNKLVARTLVSAGQAQRTGQDSTTGAGKCTPYPGKGDQ